MGLTLIDRQGMPVVLTLTDQYVITRFLGNCAQLVNYDQIWTRYLNTEAPVEVGSRLSRADSLSLQDIARRMIYTLEQIQAEGNSILIQFGDIEIRSQYGEYMEGGLLSDDVKAIIQDRLGTSVAPPVVRDVFTTQLIFPTQEIMVLTEKLNLIRQGRLVQGDLSVDYLCQMSSACIVGGLLLPFPTGLPGLLLGASILILLYQSGESC